MTENPQNPYGQPGQAPAPYGQQPPAYSQQPSAPYGQQGGPYGAPAVDPGKTMGIIAIILPFVGFSLVGLVLGIIAKSKSKKAGYKNTLALVAIIISIVAIIGSIIAIIVGVTWFVNLTNEIVEACQNGAESVTIDGSLIPCPA